MSDPYIDLCLGVQAVRRRVEREVAGLGGATGVAAAPYPHQLANVQRILSDSRIRHLIADEVGLGKTVQTLMILNALRLQNPRHRALILVPDNIAPQWLIECQTRGHFTPLGRAPEEEENGAHVRLAYYDQLGSVTEIDPNVYDLLVVDELHRLQANARQRIADVAGDFRQLLLLSATPKLDDVEAFRQLLSILEPERMAVAARTSDTPETLLREREAQAAELLRQGVSADWDAAGLMPPPERAQASTLAVTHSILRRVTHSNRRDYPDLLPQRVLHRIAIEPTADEVARQDQVWQFIGHADRGAASTDLARLGQVALRSPRALSERINILRGRDQRDPHGFLAAAGKHLEAANGDSRIEAMVDLLVDIWNDNPDEAVLIVAEDNPTVDYLERMIPQFLPAIGPRGKRRPLSLAVNRNRDASATSDLVDLFEEYDDGIGGFVDGDDQLLIAADVAQVGLNLQHARKLIFFSMPWSPVAVEQWIGRLDRLGSAALADQPGERTLDIYAIYQRGQVDERVITVLDDFAVFRRSIRLDGEEINVVEQHIIDAALTPHTVNWQALSLEARSITTDDGDALVTPLSGALPWSAESARDLADQFDRTGALGPLLEQSTASRAIVRIETGLRGWMRLMGRANGLRMWKGKNPDKPGRRFRMLHHYRSPYATGPAEPRFPLPGLDPRDGQRYAYLDSRRSLESPPVPTVHLDDNPAAPLNFLDHGAPLHEALVNEWSKIGKAVPACLRVRFPEGHMLAGDTGRGTYLLAILAWVPGDRNLVELDRSHILQLLQESRTRPEQRPFRDAIQAMEEELRADRRWVNSLFTARLDLLAARHENSAWSLVDQEMADALFVPWDVSARGEGVVLATGQRGPLALEIKAVKDAGGAMLLQEFARRHQDSLSECPDLQARIATRRYLVTSEAEDLIATRQAVLDAATAQGMETSEQGFARSRFRAIRNARDMAIHARDVRLARLDELAAAPADGRYDEYKFMVMTIE
ncbi:SNF2-related protein [Sphingomonas sp. LB2R24]|uniref:SNF2-related protein n=1 Tax=Sphingomonas sorbitolis TaxID=3096165 RepID=UPI002FCA62DB